MNNIFNNYGKRISWVQVLFIACIILLSVCTFQALASYPSMRFATPLFAVGVITIIIAAIKKKALNGSIWLLLDGVATTGLATLLISGISTPLAFASWELALGCFKITETRRLKNELSDNNRGFLFIGISEIISGWGFIIKAANPSESYSTAVAIALAIQLSAYALRYYFYPQMAED